MKKKSREDRPDVVCYLPQCKVKRKLLKNITSSKARIQPVGIGLKRGCELCFLVRVERNPGPHNHRVTRGTASKTNRHFFHKISIYILQNKLQQGV
jgi:hypothetical protein